MYLQEIQKELDYYQKLTPTNFAAERAKFFERLKIQVPFNPVFEYNDRLEVEDYEDIKKMLKKQRGRYVSSTRPKWISIDNFNQDNIDYFKHNMKAIVTSQ